MFWQGKSSFNLTFPLILIKDQLPFIYLRANLKIFPKEVCLTLRMYYQSYYII